ncbi:unnamed protein product [Closterium sp. Yama58-4]|nr:unnamed protein product [Closterium sp. Yama58-4]
MLTPPLDVRVQFGILGAISRVTILGSASLTDQRDWAGTAVALGYHGVAFNVFKGPNEKVEPRERCGVKAVPMDLLQATRERVRLALKGAQPLLDDSPSFTQLVRITATVEEGGPEVIAERLPTVVGMGYDLAAVQPLSNDSFLSACFNSKADIVSFDVSCFVPSRPSPAAVKAVMQAGRVFEFCYGPALKDRSLLAPLLQGIKEVSEVTRGKSLILSCGATSARQLKRPADVAALLALAGLTRHQFRIILSVTPKKLLARAEARRQQNQQQRSCVTIHLLSPTPQAAAVRLWTAPRFVFDILTSESSQKWHQIPLPHQCPTKCSHCTDKAFGGGGGVASGKGGGKVGVKIGGGNAISDIAHMDRSSSGGGVGAAGWGAVWEGDSIGMASAAALTSHVATACVTPSASLSSRSSNAVSAKPLGLPLLHASKQQQRQSKAVQRCVVVRAAAEEEGAAAAAAEPAKGGIKREEEKFAVINTGKWECKSCGYIYDQYKGDPSYPVAPGVALTELPDDWLCPTCGSAPSSFGSLSKELAGFAQNQAYGLGGNSLTSAQKGLLIWGSIGMAFLGFVSGYFLE